MLQDETGSTFTEGVLAGEIKVPTEQELTFYVRHGELFAKACAAITLVSISCSFRRTSLETGVEAFAAANAWTSAADTAAATTVR